MKSFDASKLSPAPWATVGTEIGSTAVNANGNIIDVHGDESSDSSFIVLARNAFDVMLRRYEWRIRSCTAGDYSIWWEVYDENDRHVAGGRWPDPFTAIVEADKWYRENVELHGKETTK